MVSVVDIFCGTGGLTHGFYLEGFNVVAGIDSDASCGYSYEYNNPTAKFIEKRLEDCSPQEISSLFQSHEPRILVGCAPCQPFSRYTLARNVENWQLVDTFAETIVQIQPDVVSMENVPDLQTYKKGKVFENFIKKLEPYYHIHHQVVYGPDYGIPQTRKRLVVLASKYGPIELLPPTHSSNQYPTVRDAIENLPPLEAGEISEADPLHRSRRLQPINLKRIQQSLPGGTWHDWDSDLVAECHRRETGQYYTSVYGRMTWDEPAPTITTQAFSYGSGRFGHPEQDRALSLREMALLQTFPSDYEFVDPADPDYSFERIGRKIGNAVPVALAQVIAKSIAIHLDKYGISTAPKS